MFCGWPWWPAVHMVERSFLLCTVVDKRASMFSMHEFINGGISNTRELTRGYLSSRYAYDYVYPENRRLFKRERGEGT